MADPTLFTFYFGKDDMELPNSGAKVAVVVVVGPIWKLCFKINIRYFLFGWWMACYYITMRKRLREISEKKNAIRHGTNYWTMDG